MTRALKIKGLKQAQKRFAKFPEEFERGLREATRDAVIHIHESIPPYPPTIPGQTYIRKGSAGLGGTLTSFQGSNPDALSRVRGMGRAVVGFIGTKLKYARFVIDEDQQAFMHKGRWWTLQGVFEGERSEIVRIYERMLREIIKSKRR